MSMRKKDLLFTLPGKIGDNLLRFPVVYQYWKQNKVKADLCLDRGSEILVKLFSQQPCIDSIHIDDEIWDYSYGGQPFDFRKDAEFRTNYQKVFHLGFRTSPFGGTHEDFNSDPEFRRAYNTILKEEGQLTNTTLICAIQSKCGIDLSTLLTEASITYAPLTLRNLCIHIETETPERYIESKESILRVYDVLQEKFDRIYIIAKDKHRKKYQIFLESEKAFLFDDYGDLTQTVKLLSTAMLIGTYGCMWALASLMKIKQIVIANTWDDNYLGKKSYPDERWILANNIKEILGTINEWKP